MVELASILLIFHCNNFQRVPNNAVSAPKMNKTVNKFAFATNSGANLTIRKPPPLTNPACIRADTGVGEFNELISQR
ncbi:Uncharacterised protein [Legionella pneumophila]|nr:Uncharacterised protein [Legionella pneumophila]